ncbi:MAG TPA: FAD-binding oxidoreductase, partial [Ktedonobacteraceae bacterium]|nr:FAD-binding oxidoreductase [Ktedonobacteraceae bacterium]
MSSTSLWQAELKETGIALSTNPLHGEVDTQVAVIGAGITGTATALWLSRAGLQVRVLEARSIASGASGRNGGFISSGTTASYAHVIERYGREQARRLWTFTVRNQEMLKGFIDELEQRGWSCSYRRNGSLKLALNESELEQIMQSALLLNEDGVLLQTPGGTLHADTLVLATNAWLPELGALVGANWLSSCIFPIRGQILATEPISEQLFPTPCSADEGYQYWRQRPDGRLVVGGWRNRSFD